MTGRGDFDVFFIGNLFRMKRHPGLRKKNPSFCIVKLVIDPLYLLFVLHKGVND